MNFFLGEKNIIHQRQVYSSLDLLEDAGGIFGAMMLIGIVLHYFISKNEAQQQLLKYYFKVNEESFVEGSTNRAEWLLKSKSLRLKSCNVLFYITSLNCFIPLIIYCLKCLNKEKAKSWRRRSKLLSKTESILQTSLDIRTFMRMQSLLITHIKIFHKVQHYPLLKLQKYVRTIMTMSD